MSRTVRRAVRAAERLQRLVAVEVGGGIREWEGVLDGASIDETRKSARGAVLAPWPEPARRTAGRLGRRDVPGCRSTSRRRRCTASSGGLPGGRSPHEVDRVELEYVLHPQPGYPFALRLSVEYRLAGDGLTVRTSAENTGDRACPFGVGHHPYIARHADDVFGPGEKHDEAHPFDGEIAIGDVTVWG